MIRRLAAVSAAALVALGGVLLAAPAHAAGGVNDLSCRPSVAHPAPVVFLHGLGATKDEDINMLQADVAAKGYCTFALTYGVNPAYPMFGGINPIAQSATEIANYIRQVLAATGAPKVDIVGHSEGGFQSLYVTKTQGISPFVDKVVAIAPPTHGTSFGGLWDLTLNDPTLRVLAGQVVATACQACNDLSVGGSAVATLNAGPIAQPGVSYTILTSKYDEMVTPAGTASFVNEPGVKNAYIQDTCPTDPVGHIGEAYDTNTYNLVENALDPANAVSFACSYGSPG